MVDNKYILYIGLNFFVLDSRNRDYLEWTEHQMVQFLDEES
jgi:hypothetical protein